MNPTLPNFADPAGRSEPSSIGVPAFTLAQLLVVMGIIGVLAGIVLPVVSLSRQQANLLQCQSNLRQLSLALLLYAGDNQGWFPGGASLYAQSPDDWVYWQPNRNLNSSAIAPYVDSFHDGAILRCPTDDWASRTTNPNPAYPPYPFSYTINEWILSTAPGAAAGLPALPLASMKHTNDVILIVDESAQTVDDGNWSPTNQNWLAIRHDHPGILPDVIPTAGFPIPNPTRRGNVAFLDGHADFVPRSYAHSPAHFDPHQ